MKQQLFTTDDAVSAACAVNTKRRGRLLAMAAGILSVLILLVTAMQFVISAGADRYSEYSDDCRKFMMDYMKDSSSYDTLVNKTYMPYRNYVETLGRDTAFQAEMKAWELATLDLKSAAIQVTNSKEYKYHLGILMDILSDTTQNSDFISSLKNMADACHVSTTKAALKFGKEYNDLNMKLNPQDAKKIAAELSDINTISSYMSVAGDISDLIEQSKNLDDLLNKLSQAQVIYDLTIGYADMMQDMYNRCDSDNTALKAALLTMRDLCNQSMSKVDMVALFAGSTVAEEAMKIALGEVQKEIVSAIGLTGTAITLAQSVGKMYANILFGTENIQAAYYELNALYNIENLIRESLANTTDADSFFAAFTLYEHVTYKAADYSTKYEEALYTNNIIGKLFAWVTGKDKQLEQYKKSIENCKGLVKLSFDTLQFSAYNAFIESKYTGDVSGYFTVMDKYTLPSEETITQNDENIELLSLQTCGLPDEDYTLNDDLTILNNLYHSSGTIDLNGHTLTINGDLILEGGSINVDGGELIVNGNYNAYKSTTNKDGTITYSNGGYLYMNNAVDKVTVNGDFNTSFEYWDSYRKLNSGSIEIKGNLNDYYCYGEGKNTYYGLYSNGTKFIFSGTGKQTITAIDGYIYFEDVNFIDTENRELVINCQVSANLCSDTYITGDATIYGNLKGHKLEVSGNLTVNSSIDIAGGDINVGEDLYNYGNISLSGGYLTVNGNYNAYKSTTNKDGTITYSNGGYLYMNNAVDKVTVNGDFNTSFEYWDSYRKLNSGSIEIKGNLNDYYCYGEGKNTYYGLYSNGTKFIFSGTGKQTITGLDGKLVLNTAEFVNKDVQIACSTDIDVDVPVRVHDYSDEWTVDVEAACNDGSKSHHCTRCDAKTDITVIPGKGHTVVIDAAVAPSCTEPGLTEGKHCSVCNTVIKAQEVIPAKGHTEVIDEAVEATCTKTGLTEGKHCSVCNTVIKAQEVVPAHGHTEVVDKAVEATCTKTGLTEGKHCSVCNTVIKAQEVIPAKGHTEVIDEAVEATCTKTGLTEGKHCSVCDATIKAQEVVPAKGHTEVVDKAVEATCTKTGLTEGKHCSVCGTVIKAQETVPATGKHSFGDWKTTKAATCTAEGTQTRTCSACGKVETATIAKTAHQYVDTVVKPTYTAQGYTLHKCSVCGNSYKDTYTAKLALAKVTGVKLGGRAADALRVNWSKNASADGYIVEMYQGNKWIRVAKITDNSTTTFRKAGLKASSVYKFRVRAYKMSGSTALYGDYSATVTARTNPSVMTGAKLGGRAADALRINWTKNVSADGYIVEMYQGNKWVRVAKITSNSTTTFRKAGLSASSVYKFRVRAYKMSDSTALYGDYSATVTAMTNPSVMTGAKLGGRAADALRINWTKNTTADGYIVEMYKGGKWVRAAKITSNSTTTFRKAGLKASTVYKFRVRAYKMSGKTALYGNFSATVTARTNPSVMKGVKIGGKAKDALRVNWTKNSSAQGYIVEMYKGGKWVRVAKIANGNTTTFRKAGLKKSTTYKFRVCAYYMSGKTALFGGYGSISGKTAAK